MTLGGRSKSAAGGGKRPFNFKIEADLWIILDLLAKENQMSKNQIINDVLRPTLAMVAKTSIVNIEEIIQKRIRQEDKNRKNYNAQTLRSFLAMFKTFDDEYKEKSANKKYDDDTSSHQVQEIPADVQQQHQRTFVQTITSNADTATNLNVSISMLQNLLYTFEVIDINTSYMESFVNGAKIRCDIYLAELQNVLKNYKNFLEKIKLDSNDWYKQEIDKKRENQHNKHKKTFTLAEFREEFAGLVLRIRNTCLDTCNKTQKKITYEEDAIYESCRYVSASINELCRADTDLVIDSYRYDDSSEFLSVDVSELKMLQKCVIDKVYCDGEPCEFSIMVHDDEDESINSHSDFTIRFKHFSILANETITKYIITIMSGCMEFSYDVEKQYKETSTSSFIDYHRDKIPNFKL